MSQASAAVRALARRPDVQWSVGRALAQGVAPAHYDAKVPGLLDLLKVNRDETPFMRRQRAAQTAGATGADPYEQALRDIPRGRGAYAKVRALGLDYDEFKRRAEAAEG